MSLTRRQEEVVRLMADGLTNAEIGQRLGITLDGAKFHVSEVMNRLGANTREEAVTAWRESRGRRFAFGPTVVWAGAVAAGAAVVAGVLLLSLSTLNGESEPSAAAHIGLAEAANRAGESTAAIKLRIQLQLAGGGGTDVSATGFVDFDDNDAYALELGNGTKQILKDDVFYVWETDRRVWRKYPSNLAAGGFNGQYWFDLIVGAEDVEFVGLEDLSGSQAAHYRFTAPYPLSAASPQHVANQYRGSPRQLDVWVENGRPVKAVQRVEKRDTGDPEQDGEVTVITIEWSDWGRKVDIQAPDPALVEN